MSTSNLSRSDDVARLLNDFERHLDEAFSCGGELLAALPHARFEERLSAVVGQPVFSHLAQAIGALGEARGHAVQGHRHLERVAEQNGIEVRSWGEEQPKPPKESFFTTAKTSPLRVAA